MADPTIKPGDVFTFDVEDRRWSVRLWAWLRGKPPPMKLARYVVTGTVSSGDAIAPAIIALPPDHVRL